MESSKRIFITGAAGFIGFHLASHLKARGDQVFGCDNFNTYYSPALKQARVKELDLPIVSCDISTKNALAPFLEKEQITHLVHLAAQAGIRHSFSHPDDYVRSNIVGFFEILETLRHYPHIKLIYASSSSVYGRSEKIPFSETDLTDSPANLYGQTKKSNELMASAYQHLYGIQATGLRFFTVYGPWGRPDMAYFSFADAIRLGKPIKLFNYGNMERDFTYIDDIVQGIVATIDRDSLSPIYNLGNHQREKITTLIDLLEQRLGKKALIEYLPKPQGEILVTYADIQKAQAELGFSPQTSLAKGLEQFLDWYLDWTLAIDRASFSSFNS
jgi:UDP-glucuronate 4-epimerase